MNIVLAVHIIQRKEKAEGYRCVCYAKPRFSRSQKDAVLIISTED